MNFAKKILEDRLEKINKKIEEIDFHHGEATGSIRYALEFNLSPHKDDIYKKAYIEGHKQGLIETKDSIQMILCTMAFED